MKSLNDIVRGARKSEAAAKHVSPGRMLMLLRWALLVAVLCTVPWLVQLTDASPRLIVVSLAFATLYCVFTTTWQPLLILSWLYATGGIHSPFYVLSYAAAVTAAVQYTPMSAAWSVLLQVFGYAGVVAAMGQLPRREAELLERVLFMIVAAALGALANAYLKEGQHRLAEEQRKLERSEKLASVGVLAAGVVHDISNPLTGIAACVQALKAPGLSPELKDHYLNVIDEALARMGHTARSLLGYAREDLAGPRLLDARSAIASCLPLIGPLLREKHVDVAMNIAEGEAMVKADPSLLGQAAMNVLLNAIHASADQGQVLVWSSREGERLGIHFSDHGTGISAEDLLRVGEPFFTTKPSSEGTGLGLSVTRRILKNHGGDLTIDSQEGVGTTVSFWLPTPSRISRPLPCVGGATS